jgi:cell wall-associated NlpC family hydrolase
VHHQTLAQREGLTGRVLTQAVRGEPVRVIRERDGWSRVRLPRQRGSYFRDGIVGWVPSRQLTAHAPRAGRALAPPRGHGNPLTVARSYLGVRYLWGGMTRRGIDCSGLTYQAFRAIGRTLPRDAADQSLVGRPVRRAHLRPGDLVFFGPGGRRSIHHVGIYAGGGLVLHAPHTGSAVQLTPLSSWSDYWGARRVR